MQGTVSNSYVTSQKFGFFSKESKDYLRILVEFTRIHKSLQDSDPNLCEARCIELQSALLFQSAVRGDSFVGRTSSPPIGFTPQIYTKRSGFGYYCNADELEILFKDADVEERLIVESLKAYWKDKDSVDLTRARYPEWVKNLLPSDDWIGESGIAFPLYRMAGAQLDFKKLVTKGIVGLKDEINSIAKGSDKNTISLYRAMTLVLETLEKVCLAYAENLENELETVDKDRQKELQLMIDTLRHLAHRPPLSFHQACQLSFLYASISGAQNYGRLDDYLGDFYSKDLKEGRLDEETALLYLGSLWELMDARKTIYDGRAIIGGKGRKN